MAVNPGADGILEALENQEQLGGVLYLQSSWGSRPRSCEPRSRTESTVLEQRMILPGGERSGVNGTPTFFLDGKRHDGSFEFEHLLEAIEAAID